MQLDQPVTEPELAAALDAARQCLNEKGMMILRRLAFERDHLKEQYCVICDNLNQGQTSSDMCKFRFNFHRGFPEVVSCRLSDWIGEQCQFCRSYPSIIADCDRCHGLGRLAAHGPAIVQQCPIREVRVTDMHPNGAPGMGIWSRAISGQSRDWWIPEPIFSLLTGKNRPPQPSHNLFYDSPEAAHADLSSVLLCWARRAAGMPDLKEISKELI